MSNIHVVAILGQWKHSRRDNEQTISLAEELSKGGKLYVKNVFFNLFIYLPSILLYFIPIWLLIKKNEGFRDVEHCDAIVVCGHRMIRYAKHLKRTAFTNAKIIQIGDPRYAVRVDALLKPEHGRFLCFCKNIIRYRGHFCKKIDPQLLDAEHKKFINIKNALKGPFIGVFIGEKKYSFKLSNKIITDFATTINNISHNMNMPLLIITRKKTQNNVIEILKQKLDCSYYLYNCKQKPNINPKLAFIDYADYFIILSGSIVKQSEIIAQEKPTFIYNKGSKSRKYRNFFYSLLIDDCARELKDDMYTLEKFKPSPLNNMEEICKKIEQIIFKKNIE